MAATRFVVLLRGINVGGIRIKMAALKDVLSNAGFAEVSTILASGNVVLTADASLAEDQVKTRIEEALRDAFNYEAWVVLVHPDALERVVDAYPFDEDNPDLQPYVLFSSESAVLDELLELAEEHRSKEERIARGDGVLYWELRRGESTDTPFAKVTAKKRFKATTTTRNMRTLRKVLAAAPSSK